MRLRVLDSRVVGRKDSPRRLDRLLQSSWQDPRWLVARRALTVYLLALSPLQDGQVLPLQLLRALVVRLQDALDVLGVQLLVTA